MVLPTSPATSSIPSISEKDRKELEQQMESEAVELEKFVRLTGIPDGGSCENDGCAC